MPEFSHVATKRRVFGAILLLVAASAILISKEVQPREPHEVRRAWPDLRHERAAGGWIAGRSDG